MILRLYFISSAMSMSSVLLLTLARKPNIKNSNLAPRLRGIKQKKSNRGLGKNNYFFLFYSPNDISKLTDYHL